MVTEDVRQNGTAGRDCVQFIFRTGRSWLNTANSGGRSLAIPERGGALATTLPATPTALPAVHLQVLRRKQMPFATRGGYTTDHWERVSEQLAGVVEARDTS
jgi:hypothetical protein